MNRHAEPAVMNKGCKDVGRREAKGVARNHALVLETYFIFWASGSCGSGVTKFLNLFRISVLFFTKLRTLFGSRERGVKMITLQKELV